MADFTLVMPQLAKPILTDSAFREPGSSIRSASRMQYQESKPEHHQLSLLRASTTRVHDPTTGTLDELKVDVPNRP